MAKPQTNDPVERQWFEEAVRWVAEETSGALGGSFLQALVQQLATVLRVRFAFTSEIRGKGQLRLTALWEGTHFGENFEYDVHGTPCEWVFKKGLCYYPSRLQETFPDDLWLQEKGIQSYLAIPLYDSKSNPLGHLGAMHDAPLVDDLPRESILRIFAARTAAELERKRGEDQLREQATQLSQANQHLSALHSVTVAANQSLALESVLQEVIKKIVEIFQFDGMKVYLLDHQANVLQMKSSYENHQHRFVTARVSRPVRGLVKMVAKSGEPIIFEDVETDLRYPQLSVSHEAYNTGNHFLSMFPIRASKGFVGVIVCMGQLPRSLSMDEIQLIKAMVNQVGIAVERSHLYEKTKRQASQLEKDVIDLKQAKNQIERHSHRLAILSEVNEAINSTLNVEVVLELLLEKIDLLLPYSATTVRLLNKETGILERTACRNIDEEKWKKRGQDKGAYAKELLQGKRPLVRNNVQTDLRTRNPDFFRELGLVSKLAVPLIVKDEALGALSIFTKNPHQFSNDEIVLLTTIAAQAATAIHNSQLHDQLEKRTRELSVLNHVTALVNRSLDLDTVLNSVIKEVSKIFGFDATRIFVLTPATNTLELKAASDMRRNTVSQFKSGRRFATAVLKSGKPLIMMDIDIDPRYPRLSKHQRARTSGFRFYAAFPAKVRKKTVGIIMCLGAAPRRLNAEEIQLIESMASQVGNSVEKAQLYQETKKQASQMQMLSRRLVGAQEVERHTIARELQDEIGQVLTGLKLTLEASKCLPVNRSQKKLVEAQGLINELMVRVRGLSLDLRPAMLDDLGLVPTLLWLFDRFASQTNVTVKLKHSRIKGRRFGSEVETATFRILQEAVTNVTRHAGVNETTVSVWANKGTLKLQVEDPGAGFDVKAVMDSGLGGGLADMRERATSINGQFAIESRPRVGTKITATLPLGNKPKRQRRGNESNRHRTRR